MSCAVCGADDDGPRHHVFLGPSTAWHHQAVGCSGRLNCPTCAGNLLADVLLEQLGMVALSETKIDDEVARLRDQILAAEAVPRPLMVRTGDKFIETYFSPDRLVKTYSAPRRRGRWRLRARPMDARAWADVALIGTAGDIGVLIASHHMPGPEWLRALVVAAMAVPLLPRTLRFRPTRRTT